MTFKINGIDFSSHVIAGSYDVNTVPQYREFKDGNRVTHRTAYATKVKGSFNMFFRTATEPAFAQFVAAVGAGSLGSQNKTIFCSVNNAGYDKQIDGFVSFAPVRDRDQKWRDYMKVFKVTIEEA